MIPALPATLEDFSPEWIADRREIIDREGYAVRAGAPHFTIEIKSLVTNEWHRLTLANGSEQFATADDRDAVLSQLHGQRQAQPASQS